MLIKFLETILGENWGKKVFFMALGASLVFFWWLLIYSHGVTPHGQ